MTGPQAEVLFACVKGLHRHPLELGDLPVSALADVLAVHLAEAREVETLQRRAASEAKGRGRKSR